jgi:hypothetical protein
MGYRRVFRQHVLPTLLLPGLPWIAAITLLAGGVLFLLLYSPLAIGLLLPALFPVARLLRLYVRWLSYSVVAVAGSNTLTLRSGIVTAREQLIPLTDFSPAMYEQPRWAVALGLDLGSITIATMDGRKVFPRMGDFSELWTVIQSRGQIVPRGRPSALVAVGQVVWRSAVRGARWSLARLSSLVLALLARVRTRLGRRTSRRPPAARGGMAAPQHPFGLDLEVQRRAPRTGAGRPAPRDRRRARYDGGYIYRGTYFSPQTPSSAGLYAFCQQFVLTDGNWAAGHYQAADRTRRYYPNGIRDRLARLYLDQLRQKSILIPVNGRERLSSRIGSIRDIKRLIPVFPELPDRAA